MEHNCREKSKQIFKKFAGMMIHLELGIIEVEIYLW
jgi:hypothetical protein